MKRDFSLAIQQQQLDSIRIRLVFVLRSVVASFGKYRFTENSSSATIEMSRLSVKEESSQKQGFPFGDTVRGADFMLLLDLVSEYSILGFCKKETFSFRSYLVSLMCDPAECQ